MGKENGSETRKTNERGRTGHAELRCWSPRGLRSAREMRARGYSPPGDVRFGFRASRVSHLRHIIAAQLKHAEVLVKA